MDTQVERPLQSDLALIYLAMAHSTDEDLSDDEITAMAERLNMWHDDRARSIAGDLRSAVEEYLMADGPKRVKQAILRVRQELPREKRQALVDDLVKIAIADHRFLHRESTFIGELVRAWEISLSDEQARPWSILSPDENAQGWTVVHDLALIYLALAQRTDNDLCEEEVGAISDKLQEWMPDADRESILNVVRDALATYVQGPDERVFEDSVESVGRLVPSHQRGALLEDLRHVAEADGVLLDSERKLIGRLEKAWTAQA